MSANIENLILSGGAHAILDDAVDGSPLPSSTGTCPETQDDDGVDAVVGAGATHAPATASRHNANASDGDA